MNSRVDPAGEERARRLPYQIAAVAMAAAVSSLVACGSDDNGGVVTEDPAPNVVQKASCGTGDRPETGLQGQVPAALRAAGFQGFSCNLELVSAVKSDGGSWQHAFFHDGAGRKCSYFDSSSA